MNDPGKELIRPLDIPVSPQGTFRSTYCIPDAHGSCPTCSDEALPATVMEVSEDGWTAWVETSTGSTEVDVSLIDGVKPGEVVLVHGGVAIGLLAQDGHA